MILEIVGFICLYILCQMGVIYVGLRGFESNRPGTGILGMLGASAVAAVVIVVVAYVLWGA